MINIKNAKKGINRFGARKYANIPSHTDPDKTYTVAKFRKRGAHHYFYACTCPVSFYKKQTCKHIVDFINAEEK